MTKTPDTPIDPDPLLTPDTTYASAADEFAREDAAKEDEKDDDEEDEGSSEGDKGGKRGAGKKQDLGAYEVKLDRSLLDLTIDDKIEPLQALLDILRKLKLIAPSEIIRGASTFGNENTDITLREIGLLTAKVNRSNIADPDLLKKLDAAQRALRQRENIPHPDDHLLAGDSSGQGGVLAAIGLMLDTMVDKAKPAEQKAQNARDRTTIPNDDTEAGYGSDKSFSSEADDLMTARPETDMSDLVNQFDDLQFDHPDHVFASTEVIQVDPRRTDFDTLHDFFNAITHMTADRVDKVTLRQNLHLIQNEPAGHSFDI